MGKPLYLCPCCGTVTRQVPIRISPMRSQEPGQRVVFYASAVSAVLRGEWLGMDTQFPWEGRVLVMDRRYRLDGGSARVLVEPRKVWREGELQGVLTL